MFKIIIFLVIVIVGSYFIYDYVHLSFFNDYKLTHIKADNLKYKSIPKNQEGFNFVGDSLEIYDVTREKLLPKKVMKNEEVIEIDDINKKETSVNTNNINNLYLQLASYKTIEKAKKLINEYKVSSNLILNKLNLKIISADLGDRGTYYRVRAGPYNDIKDVYELCLALNVNDNECLIVQDK
mgnify:FL=1